MPRRNDDGVHCCLEEGFYRVYCHEDRMKLFDDTEGVYQYQHGIMDYLEIYRIADLINTLVILIKICLRFH